MKNSKNNNKEPQWQVSPPKTLITTPVMNLLSGRVHCPRNGLEKDFYKLEFSEWVNIIAITEQQELLLIRQYRFGTNQTELEIPGGAVEDGEPPLDAGLRELLEETGYAGVNGRIIGKVCPNPAIQGNLCYTVLVENVKKVAEPKLDEMEDIEVLRVPVDEVLSLAKDGTIQHGLVLNGLMFYTMTRQ